MSTLLLGVVIVGVSVLLAHVGLRLVRRRVPLPVLQTQHEVAGFIIGVLGAIYAVLLAFVVVVMWNQFEDAKVVVEQEANQLIDLSRMAAGLPAAAQKPALDGLRSYARAVLDEEWQTMADGRESQRAQKAMDGLWQVYSQMEPQSNRESALYAESLDRLSNVSDSRRLRLHASSNDMPLIVQVLLWLGALVTVSFTYFFGVKSIRSQALMTAALAGEIAFLLFLIVALDNPFHGYVRLSPEPIEQALERIQAMTPQ
jgi:hypothetical protein